jgi:hypothetical protein
MSDNQLALFDPSKPEEPCTPLARMLHAHFASGGSKSDGVRLLEEAELASGANAGKSRASNTRGYRLSPDWAPSPSDVAYATHRGMAPFDIQNEAEKFRNYWVAKSGASATKRDWSATWRNWIINSMERANGSPRSPNVQATSQGNPFGRIAVRLRQSSGS